MAKIYRSYQVKIDNEHSLKISTGVKAPTPRPAFVPDEEDGEFKEVPLDQLTSGSGGGGDETQPTQSGLEEPMNDADAVAHKATSIAAARASAVLAAANRRASELALFEENLRDLEKSLQEREKRIETEEQKLHQEIMTRRKGLEDEAAKILDISRKSADNILKTSTAEAETMKKSVQIEVETLRAKAQKEGFALGEQKGLSAGEKSGFDEGQFEWNSLMQETEALITELQTSRIGILKASEEEMVRLILAFAKRVIKIECLTRPEIIMKNIDAALNKISDVDKIVLRINMRDKSMTEARKDDFMKRLSGMGELRIQEDSSLAPGGLKIETGVGTIDATIESQAEELERAILKILERAE